MNKSRCEYRAPGRRKRCDVEVPGLYRFCQEHMYAGAFGELTDEQRENLKEHVEHYGDGTEEEHG